MLYRSPLSASRWKLGVWIGPPKVLVAPKPTSSVRINKILGAPAEASIILGKSGVESFTVRPICPSKGGWGGGKMLGVSDIATRGSDVAATADAAMTELEPSNRRRLISTLRTQAFLSDFSSLIDPPRGVRQFRASAGFWRWKLTSD